MFWPRVKSIFLDNISLFIALFILAVALAVYFPSLSQEGRLIEKRDYLNKESLAQTEMLDEALLLRDDLLEKTQGIDSQVKVWENRTQALKSHLIEDPDPSSPEAGADKAANKSKAEELNNE